MKFFPNLSAYRLIFLISLLFIFSCSPKREDTIGSLKIFRYNEPSGIASLDPAYAKDLPHIWACNQLYNGLVSLNPKLEVIPAIAKKWEVSDDGLTYVFTLRNDVFFHDNLVFNGLERKVTAYDFVYSFNRLMNPGLSSPGTWIFNQVEKNNDQYSFEALSDTVLSIRLKRRFPPFLGLLTMPYASVISHEAITHYGNNYRHNPVGTGPFRFKYWKEGVKLVLVKNEQYFECSDNKRLPFLDGVSISFLTDKQVAFMEFAKGELDFMSGIDARYKDELLTRTGVLRTKYQNKIKLYREPYLNTEYLGILLSGETNSPFNSLKFRQSVNHAIDRKKLIRFLRNGIGRPGHQGMIPPGLPGYNENAAYGYSYNPEKARKLLTESGYSGQTITLTTTADYVDIAKFVQSQLEILGIDIRVEISPAAMMRELRAKSKLEFFRSSWVADYPDAENYMSLFLSSNKAPNGPNYTHYESNLFDSLYKKSMTEIRDEDRNALYSAMDSLAMNHSPVVVLFYDEVLRFVHPRIINLGSNPINLLDLKHTDIDFGQLKLSENGKL
jgi:peptide/nickel transport system substrate-binding protein